MGNNPFDLSKTHLDKFTERERHIFILHAALSMGVVKLAEDTNTNISLNVFHDRVAAALDYFGLMDEFNEIVEKIDEIKDSVDDTIQTN